MAVDEDGRPDEETIRGAVSRGRVGIRVRLDNALLESRKVAPLTDFRDGSVETRVYVGGQGIDSGRSRGLETKRSKFG